MVRGYYNKVYTFKVQKCMSNNKKAIEMFEVNKLIRTKLMYLFKRKKL